MWQAEQFLNALTYKGVHQNAHWLEAADFQAVLAAVQQDGWLLKHASVDMKNNEEVVLAAVKQDSWALQFATIR